MSKHTPMMQQYLKIKENYPNDLVFYRMGDFYELFFEDAVLAANILNITLTSRSKSNGEPIQMAGVPHHAAEAYIIKLIKAGYKVVICEQEGNSINTKGLINRKVNKIITPGTIIEDEYLANNDNNIIVAISEHKGLFGLASLDVSTADFNVEEFKEIDALLNTLDKYQPAEVLLQEDFILNKNQLPENARIEKISPWKFDFKTCREFILDTFKINNLDTFKCEHLKLAICCAGVLLEYVSQTQNGNLNHINKISVSSDDNYLAIDSKSQNNLELINPVTKNTDTSLIKNINKTSTALGYRLLKKWLLKPLVDIDTIKSRQLATNYILNNTMYKNLSDQLKQISDIERINTRINLNSASPKDLENLKKTCITLNKLNEILNNQSVDVESHNRLHFIKSNFQKDTNRNKIIDYINKSIVEEPTNNLKNGGIIREGFDVELDRLRSISNNSAEHILKIEAQEQENTKNPNLKISYNKIHGFYIELSKSYKGDIPEHFNRKQTLKNVERYTTKELQDFEYQVITSKDQALSYEKQLYTNILNELSNYCNYLQSTAKDIAELDIFCNFALLAFEREWVLPEFNDNQVLEIKDGRHPVVESLSDSFFTPNHCYLDNSKKVYLITGPNMGGKSTFMRQVALIVILSYLGSFVPAESASIPLINKLFTRIGSGDDIANGKSTFMVEMNEAAYILNNADKNSLILMDEIGRGTSTYDGVAIAKAIIEHILKYNHSFCLFATHYFELCRLETKYQGLTNMHFSAIEKNDEITFLHKIEKGPAAKSFGIQVAKLAGIPSNVISLANEHLLELERE